MGIDDDAVVETAIDAGYRHLDTAQIYDNERVVGRGIDDADTPRSALTVATKLWTDCLAGEDVRAGTEASLDRLGLDAVDLLYVHRPRGGYDPATTLPALERVRDAGLTHAVALSNFEPDALTTAREYVDIAAHQVEFHPFYHREDLLADAQRHGYPLVAYSPLAGGEVFDDPTIRAVADEYDTTPAAVSIAWVTSHDGVVTIPKASAPAHLRANLAAADLELAPEDIQRIDDIDREVELFPE